MGMFAAIRHMSEIEHSGDELLEHYFPAEENSGSSRHWCEFVPDAILCLDERWRILFANRAASEMFSTEQRIESGKPAWQWPELLSTLGELQLDTLKSAGRGQRHFRALRAAELHKGGTRTLLEVAIAVAGDSDDRIFTL